MEQNKEPMPDINFPDFIERESRIKTIITVGIILAVVVVGVLLYINIPSKKEEPVEFIKQQVDSLAKANAELQAKHQVLDSMSKTYQIQIYDLDWKLSNVGHDKTIIREYYHDKVKEPATYTPKQVDSFFKKRYNY